MSWKSLQGSFPFLNKKSGRAEDTGSLKGHKVTTDSTATDTIGSSGGSGKNPQIVRPHQAVGSFESGRTQGGSKMTHPIHQLYALGQHYVPGIDL